jgi:hypothetical protein
LGKLQLKRSGATSEATVDEVKLQWFECARDGRSKH